MNISNKYETGIVHVHSENSRYDSTMSVKDMCRKAKELGYDAITLTDHGTLTGIDDFVSAAKEAGIKPIPGVEVYVQEDGSENKRLHLILLAVDDLGYQGISKIVTASNKRIDRKGFPRVNKAILEEYCQKGKPYHGHVIATSACAGGVLAGILLKNQILEREIEKTKRKQAEFGNPESPEHKKNLKFLEDKISKMEELRELRDFLKKTATRSYKKRENQLKKLIGTAEYEDEEKRLLTDKKESEEAETKLNNVKVTLEVTQRDITSIKGRIRETEKKLKKYAEYQEKIDEFRTKILPFEDLYCLCKQEALYYQSLFGTRNFYIEIQYHGFENEHYVFTHLAAMAKELSIPIVGANDAHMVDGSENAIRARQIIQSIRYAKAKIAVKVAPGDEMLYLKDELGLKKALLNVLPEPEVMEAIGNAYQICSRCNCNFENGTHYPKFTKLKQGETSDAVLRKMAYDKISDRYLAPLVWSPEHEKRLEYELEVISKMGFSDYFLIIQDVLNFGRRLGYINEGDLQYLKQNIRSMTLSEMEEYVNGHKTQIGYVVGPGRGSAAGSVVAYLVGITDIEPITYGLLFERFLNEDRVSMPDVDSDFSPGIRDLVVEYCKKLYGVETVAGIVTKGYISPKGAVRNVGRVLGTEKDAQSYYASLSDKIARLVPSKPGTTFATCEEEIRAQFVVDPKDSTDTKAFKKDANELIDQSKLVEKVFLNYGMHAAGVIIADGRPIHDVVPMMRDEKSGDMKIQCNMIQAEEIHGLLKFDFLGLRNLNIITLAIRSIKTYLGVEIEVSKLPFEKEVFRSIFATGRTGSVFQFESPGMKQMLRDAKPDCFEDIISGVSLYRPGPMDYIPKYIDSKRHPEKITYLCPELEPILGKTYGVIVYQEQVMEIVQKLAGFSLAQADNVRRYMSKKKFDKLEHEREDFISGNEERNIEGCEKRGITEAVANELFDQMVEFAKYAFNKSHAVAYSMISYVTAWLKFHYPIHYMCAVLNCTDKMEKMPSVLNDCQEMGVEVLPPRLNRSQLGFSIYEDKIIFGLDSVKGTSSESVQRILNERELNGEFVSLKNLLSKDLANKTTYENLIKAGAMDEFNPSRIAMLNYYSEAASVVKSISDRKRSIIAVTEQLEKTPESKKHLDQLSKDKQTLGLLKQQLEVIRIVDVPEDLSQRMKMEKEVLGFFISAHPMDQYREPEELGCIPISNLEDTGRNMVNIIGLVQNLKVTITKKDSKQMALFQLEDKTGIIDVCCFPNSYSNFRHLIKEDMVLKIRGNVKAEEMVPNTADDEENVGEVQTRLQIYLESVQEVIPDSNYIAIKIRSMLDWNDVLQSLKKKGFLCNSGHPLVILDELTGEFRNTCFYVKEEILHDTAFETKINI